MNRVEGRQTRGRGGQRGRKCGKDEKKKRREERRGCEGVRRYERDGRKDETEKEREGMENERGEARLVRARLVSTFS